MIELLQAIAAVGGFLFGGSALIVELARHRRATRHEAVDEHIAYVEELRGKLADIRIDHDRELASFKAQLEGAFSRINDLTAQVRDCKEREIEYLRKLADLGYEHLRAERARDMEAKT